MDIGLYEDWMKPQVAQLFSTQYGIKEEDFARLIDNFYEHSFQKNKCIRIIAKERDVVIGFQSFFYWPYKYNGKMYNSYQSGNSLVHPEHRGKGVFQKLLNYLDIHRERLNIDFVIGFPIDVSIGSLIRNKWINLFNLQWYVKLVNPLSVMFPLNISKLNNYLPNKNLIVAQEGSVDHINLFNTPEFDDWRSTHYDNKKYFSFAFKKGNHKLLLKLKINTRKKIIKELIIGGVITTSHELSFLESAFIEFFKTIKKIKCISLVSIAYNTDCDYNLATVLSGHGFKKINKQIYFCVKIFADDKILIEKNKWIVYRGDIDTW